MGRSFPADTTADNFDDLAAIMEEPAGGRNYGRTAVDDPHLDAAPRSSRFLDLSVEGAQTRDRMNHGGWIVVHEKQHGAVGMTSHRGVLAPGEYVDPAELRARLETALGFTTEDVHSVYRQGRLSFEQRKLRGRIDARFLALSQSGANMTTLARALGLHVHPKVGCLTITRAIARARVAQAVAA